MASILNATTTAGVTVTGDNSGSLQLATNNGTTAVTIDTSQNVGIGTSSPSSFASTTNLALGTGSSGAALTVFTGTAQTGAVYFADGTTSADRYRGAVEYSHGNNALAFTTDASERMRIDSSGNLLVGTTTAQAPITAVFASGGAVLSLDRTSNIDATLRDMVQFRRSVTSVGTISCSNTATAYNTSSDYRLKENIAPMTGALAKIQQLKPCTYTWKIDGSSSQGFIAHELQAIVPECVNGEKDAVDDNGNPIHQGVDTSFLVATLTAAIQELKAELDATKAEVQALKGTL